MSEAVLVLTHVLAFLVGCAVTWWLMVRKLEVSEHDGHLTLEVRHPDE